MIKESRKWVKKSIIFWILHSLKKNTTANKNDLNILNSE